MNFGTARKTKEYTQEEVAKLLMVDRSTISKWESGESLPRAELLPKLAQLYGCTIDELLQPTE